MPRYLCVHGHFYQPPRENPWLEAIELEESAAPYHDWNARITRECYAPNAVSRLLDDQERIVNLVNNYAKISFNFGPTLLSWLEHNAPDVYAAILNADRQSRERFSGHGSALAQIYNHIIMPLANPRDRVTQIIWGIRDFEHRFKRAPEGMWLPETAVDLTTLDQLARFGIRFTVLAPHQAARVRRSGEIRWHGVKDESIDCTQVYRQQLPSGRSIAVFFYDGAIARAVAFEGLLANGEHFLERLTGAFGAEPNRPELVHIATDGETYGHHHRFGDMALAYVLEQIPARGLARLTNYGEYLANYPPIHEVEIREKTSWSCAHGIERWRSDCGCNSGAQPGWNQRWRTPLREALDWLRDHAAAAWERKAARSLKDPWAARNDYIEVVLDRSEASVKDYFARHALHALDAEQTTTALKLLEMQRYAMLMYTSCGWFFDDAAGLETVQVLRFAARAAQLAQDLFGDSLEKRFIRRFSAVRSNVPEEGDGARIYERRVRSAIVDWHRLAAHCALGKLLEQFPERITLYSHDARLDDWRVLQAGRARVGVGILDLRSEATLESRRLMVAALHLGDHHLSGAVAEFIGEAAYQEMAQRIAELFTQGDLTAVVGEMERRFAGSTYSLRSLIRDEQRTMLKTILAANLRQAEALHRQIYEPSEPLLRFLTEVGIPLPKEFAAAADVVWNVRLRRALEQAEVEFSRVNSLLEAARLENIPLETASLEVTYRETLERLAAKLVADPTLDALKRLTDAMSVMPRLPFSVDLWRVQNLYFQLLAERLPSAMERPQEDECARRWTALFRDLGRALRVKVPD